MLTLIDRAGLGLTKMVGIVSLPVLSKPHALVRWFGRELSA